MGFFQRLKEGLKKTRQNIAAGFDNIFSGNKSINDDFFEELEEVMIMGDMGVSATYEILDDLKVKIKENKLKEASECRQLLIESIRDKIDLGPNAYEFENQKSVLLVIGVNGVGKTTSVGKLASGFKQEGKRVMLAAADTFRAGAIEQLKVWGQRAGVDVISQAEGADPAAVIYDACQSAKAKNIDLLIADTAGRLHNKKNLMNELAKIDRVITREFPDAYRETLLVLDATIGQNAINQLREFNEAAKVTGIILTKMDGTAKGGIVVAIQAEFGIPVKYIGVGEKIEDLQKFDSNAFVDALFDESSREESSELEYAEISLDEAETEGEAAADKQEDMADEAKQEEAELEEGLDEAGEFEDGLAQEDGQAEEFKSILMQDSGMSSRTDDSQAEDSKDDYAGDEKQVGLNEAEPLEESDVEQAELADNEQADKEENENEEKIEDNKEETGKKKGFFSRLFSRNK